MALRAVPEHPKFARLKRALKLSKFEALGLLETLWHFTGKFAPRGNVGRFSDAEIEDWVEWPRETGTLIEALIQTGWIDRNAEHRLVVHDWNEHADQTTKKQLGRTKQGFVQDVSGQTPDVASDIGNRDGPPVPLPLPEPAPAPEPVKPSRRKGESDGRHAEFRAATKAYWESCNVIPMPWDGGEAKQLWSLLSANPAMDVATFRELLRRRYRSTVNHADRPRSWLAKVTDYAGGPLNEFNKPKGGKSGDHKNVDAARAAIEAIEDRSNAGEAGISEASDAFGSRVRDIRGGPRELRAG